MSGGAILPAVIFKSADSTEAACYVLTLAIRSLEWDRRALLELGLDRTEKTDAAISHLRHAIVHLLWGRFT